MSAPASAALEAIAEHAPAIEALIRAARSEAIPRRAYSPDEAAAALGVSRDSFDRYVKPELRLVRRGRLVIVPARELDRWLDENAARTLP